MTELIIESTRSKSKPIPINNKCVYAVPFSNFSKYLFELKLKTKQNKIKHFRKIENEKWAEIVSVFDRIKYEDILTFNISITQLPDGVDKVYTLKGELNDNFNTFTKNNDYIYIEFTKNNQGYLVCTCHFIGYEELKLSISPLT